MNDNAISLVDEAVIIDQAQTIFAHVLRNRSCAVYLFGSRAAGTARLTADFDVGVLADEEVSRELS